MIQAIDRAATVLSSPPGGAPSGYHRLAAALDLPPSTVHGIVKSLQQHGLVAKEPGQPLHAGAGTAETLQCLPTPSTCARGRCAGRGNSPGAPASPCVSVPSCSMRSSSSTTTAGRMAVRADARERGCRSRLMRRRWARSCSLTTASTQRPCSLSKPLRSLTGDTMTDAAKLTLALLAQIAERGIAHRGGRGGARRILDRGPRSSTRAEPLVAAARHRAPVDGVAARRQRAERPP